ncbi:OprD family outer membrane porin [Spirosoma spitsbergense]|uniref:OprD family outer membrane porin n=1 Tax=Spirosoma spitsbergense TaxID=431554 RepID=UPI00038089BC|nr:OprD family outer membrane porin [Spirosoma spitsbergense]
MTRLIPFILLTTYLLLSGKAVRAELPDTLARPRKWASQERFLVRVRSMFIATDNKPGLTDSYALGMGIGLGYQTPRLFGHLQLRGSAFFSGNLVSSDLALRDPLTNQPNRYEVGLFNLQNPGSHALITRLEELNAQYHFGERSVITVGRQLPRSPFINGQDGRLSPTFAEGVKIEWDELGQTKIQAEYWWRMAPRSTIGWHSIGESIGLYPVGVDAMGKPSQYAGYTTSAGIVQLGITHKRGPITWQFWDTHVLNVFNVAYARADAALPVGTDRQVVVGLQLARECTVGTGGNSEVMQAYSPPGNRSTVVSGRIGYQQAKWAAFLNATHITGEGRFLMPREWGREPFYTFLMRERNEGFGNVTATGINLFYTPVRRLKLEASVGYLALPDVKDYRLNKYGMPSHVQTNLNVTYQFAGFLNGFDGQFLWVHKWAVGSTYNTDKYVFNKVDMNQLNVVLNYKL